MLLRLPVMVLAILASLAPLASAKEPWADAMAAFERQDKESPPPPGEVLFVGSSSIRLWDLKRSFGDLLTINRGFGGSQAADSARHVQTLVVKHRPRVVVFYAGDNDLAAGKSPQQVCDDVESFVKPVTTALPEARVLYLAIKPSVARWKLIDRQRDANRLIGEMLARYPRTQFVDVATPLLGDDQTPRRELFVADGLHLSEAGYKVWTDALRPLLQ